MADWYQLAKDLALVDKRIDKHKAEVIQEVLLADGKIDKTEFKYLISLRREAEAVAPEFDEMVFKTIKKAVVHDGELSVERTKWQKGLLLSDGVIDDGEKRFLQDLRKSTKHQCEEFLDWCRDLGIR